MPAPCPGDDDYDHGNVHSPGDIRAVAQELGARRDVVPLEPDPAAWQRTGQAAGRSGLTLITTEVIEDPDGVPLAMTSRSIPVEMGRPVGSPTITEEITAWCADPRNELGDDYDPEIDGPLPPGLEGDQG